MEASGSSGTKPSLSVAGAGSSGRPRTTGENFNASMASSMSDASTNHRPWTNDEHYRFLEALEAFGNGTSGMEWQQIARHVGTRTYNEIKLHAHKYFIKLQQATQQRKASGVDTADETPADLDDGSWTFTEDLIFENALARYDESTSGRWETISQLLVGKTTDDVRKRYQKLLFDIARIENGEVIELTYKSEVSQGSSAVAVPPTIEEASSPKHKSPSPKRAPSPRKSSPRKNKSEGETGQAVGEDHS